MASMKKLTKSELNALLAEKLGTTKAEAGRTFAAICEVVHEAIYNEGAVKLDGLGTLYAKDRPARTVRSPQTGKPIKVPARTVTAFRAAKSA